MDTTRADRLGVYGHEKARTPAIDRFANEGTRFERAYATVPLTIPSHASMFTSLYPPRHGVHNNGDAILPESALTLAEVLQEQGYQTAASISAFVTTRAWNLDQGFDSYFDSLDSPQEGQGRWSSERRADSVVDDLEGWLTEVDASRPSFIWAHFYDPHHPYTPPESMRAEFGRRTYDAEIAFMDSQIARLRTQVEAHLGENVAWILVADHGEALTQEHGEQTHGLYLFDPTMRIPFILRPATPQASATVVSDLAVSNVDVMATALGLVGVDIPEALDGIDLSPLSRGESPSREPVYMESENVTQRFGFAPEVAMVEEEWKLMDTPNPLLFNTDSDPNEQANLIEDQPERVAKLQELSQKIRSQEPELDGGGVAPELMEELMALGYISHDVQDQGAMSDMDAKDHKQIVFDLEMALRILREGGDPQKAEARYRAIIEEYESLGEARLGLARALNYQERQPEAEEVLRTAIELQPQSTILRSNLSNTLAAQGRHDEGLALMEGVLDQVPEDDMARIGILRMLTDLERYEEAIQKCIAWLDDDPDHEGLQAHLGVALARSGRLDEAVTHLQASLSDEVPRQLVHRMLAQEAMLRNDIDSAIHHLEIEVDTFHRNAHAHGELAALYLKKNQLDSAKERLDKATELGRPYPTVRLKLAQAYFNSKTYDTARAVLSPLLKSMPMDPFVLKLHAELLHKEGRVDEATQVFNRAQEILKVRRENGPGKTGEAPAR